MPVRLLVSIAILIVAFLVLFLVLIATETALTVWHYLKDAPPWIQLSYALILVGLPLLTLVLFWNWFKPARKQKPVKKRELKTELLEDELLESARQGIDVSEALEEMREQRRRRGSGEIYMTPGLGPPRRSGISPGRLPPATPLSSQTCRASTWKTTPKPLRRPGARTW
jgi:hypothetical protein